MKTRFQFLRAVAARAGVLAFCLVTSGCFFGSPSSNGGTSQSADEGVKSMNFFNCSKYGISAYRRKANGDFDFVGSSGTYAINGSSCDEATATPLVVPLIDGQDETIWVLFTKGNCVNNPSAASHCFAEQYYARGSSTGGIDDYLLTKQ